MAKDKIAYVCENCGYDSTKWIGRCPNCGQWNTFKEIRISANAPSPNRDAALGAASALNAVGGRKGNRPYRLSEIPSADEPRIDMGDNELNRVLGGGLVPGSIVLLGGEPGIGKSTLILQTVLGLKEKVLYVSGE